MNPSGLDQCLKTLTSKYEFAVKIRNGVLLQDVGVNEIISYYPADIVKYYPYPGPCWILLSEKAEELGVRESLETDPHLYDDEVLWISDKLGIVSLDGGSPGYEAHKLMKSDDGNTYISVLREAEVYHIALRTKTDLKKGQQVIVDGSGRN